MAYKLQIDELNTFDHESYIEDYFKPMRISKERKEERKQASRDFRDYLLFIFLLLGVQSEYSAVNWSYIEDQYRREFERVALQYAGMSQALTNYIAEKASDFVNVTRENIDKGSYWTSDERATYEAVNEANDVVGLEEYQRAIEEGKTHKIWHTERDNRVRDTHRVMEGVKIPITEMFEVGNGLMRYPHDWYYNPAECPNCRCSCEYTGSGKNVVELKKEYNRGRSITTIEDLRKVSNSSIINMSSQEEIENYFSSTHGIKVEGFPQKRLDDTKISLAGLDDMLNDFPEIKKNIKTIVYVPDMKPMGQWSSEGIVRISRKGLKDYGTGVHEASHSLDYVRTGTGDAYADIIVKKACVNLKLNRNSREYRNLTFQITQDVDDAKDSIELFAYAMETAKTGVNNILASEILRLVYGE